MSGLRVTFNAADFSTKMRRALSANERRIGVAIMGTARGAAKQIIDKGRADIAAGGNFGTRWTNGFNATVQPNSEASLRALITVTMDIPYWEVFQTGATITGKPLLWLPIEPNTTPIKQFKGRLIYVARLNKAPLFVSAVDHVPKYVGIPKATLKKRFHLREIIEKIDYAGLYAANLKA